MHTLLVVDDEPNYLIILSELLIEEGFEVFTADNGAKALQIAEAIWKSSQDKKAVKIKMDCYR